MSLWCVYHNRHTLIKGSHIYRRLGMFYMSYFKRFLDPKGQPNHCCVGSHMNNYIFSRKGCKGITYSLYLRLLSQKCVGVENLKMQ